MLAPAKLNLYLHILGVRADGYHELETLVAFTALTDTLDIEPAVPLSLTVTGQFAAFSGDIADNLVIRAGKLLMSHTGCRKGASITLTKNIPAGAGLGGGSADAAAALKLLNDFWELNLSMAELADLARQLGADVAMCLLGRPVIARGVGEQLTPLEAPLPPLWAVLIYPMHALGTAEVYAMLGKGKPPASPNLAACDSAGKLFKALANTRNQLQAPAISLMPEVAEILLALETSPPHADFVRMTGSGSACYALMADADQAAQLAGFIRARYPAWWVTVTKLESA